MLAINDAAVARSKGTVRDAAHVLTVAPAQSRSRRRNSSLLIAQISSRISRVR